MTAVLQDVNGRSLGPSSGSAPEKGAARSSATDVENRQAVREVVPRGSSGASTEPQNHGGSCKLSRSEVHDIYKNCIKLAAESKINAKNSFSLRLIEHMEDLVKPADGKTNFQQASCTLDAGVQIYSYRVDAVHTDAFKTLQGLNRTAVREEDDNEGQGGEELEGEAAEKQRRKKPSNPESTLEKLEAITVKKFDLGFSVDPLFHRTSAQFDAGGANGLLLYNLNVLNCCNIVFDSQDVPERLLGSPAPSKDVKVEVPSFPSPIEGGSAVAEISPAVEELRRRLTQAGGAVQRTLPDPESLVQEVLRMVGDQRRLAGSHLSEGVDLPADEPLDTPTDQGGGSWEPESAFFTAEEAGGGDEGESSVYFGMSEEFGGDVSAGRNMNMAHMGMSNITEEGVRQEGEDADEGEEESLPLHRLLTNASLSAGLLSGGSWAGASHWRFRAAAAMPKGTPAADNGESSPQRSTATNSTGRGRARKSQMDFLALPPLPKDAFKLAARPASLCLAASTLETRAATLLPEDHKYQVHSLAKLFLRPRSLWARRRVQLHGGFAEGDGGYHGLIGATGPADDTFGGVGFDDDSAGDHDALGFGWPEEDSIELAQAARKVNRMEINYSRAAKQVDVRALKQLLWDNIDKLAGDSNEDSVKGNASRASFVSFSDLLKLVPDYSDAGVKDDLSVHLCFICTLHLANEHGLRITSSGTLDTLDISING